MREYLLVFLVAAAATYLLTVIAREIAIRANAVAAVRDRDVHATPIPYLGGLAMMGGLTAAYLVARQLPFLSRSDPLVFRDAGIVLIAGAMICAVGVLDDLIELDPATKLGGQVLAAGFLIYNQIQYFLFYLPDGGQFAVDPDQGALLTVFVVVATVNAVNFVDGLDGLAAGVIGLGAVAFFGFCYRIADYNGVTLASTGALLSAALAGACFGFLPHNFHPARIFMGDSGAMLLGLTVAAATIIVTGKIDPNRISLGQAVPVFLPIVLPVAVLALPLLDMMLAVVRRLRAGQSPFRADRMHLHHRLLDLGHSHRGAVTIMYLWTAVISFGAASLALFPTRYVVMGTLVAAALAAALTRRQALRT